MRRWVPLFVGFAAWGCAGRSASGGESGTEATSASETDADTSSSGGEGDETETETGTTPLDQPPDDPGPYLDGLPSACTDPPTGLLHLEQLADSHLSAAGFEVSQLGAIALTSRQDAAWWLTVLCPDGSDAWRVQLPVDDDDAFLRGIAFGPDGDVWVSGGNFAGQSYERMVARYSVEGELRWVSEYPGNAYPEIQLAYSPLLGITVFAGDADWGPAGYAELALDIEVDAAGRAWVTGDVDDAVLGNDAWTAELGDMGDIVWEQRSGLADLCETGFDLELDGDGFVTASVHAVGCEVGSDDFELVVRRSGLAGQLEWETVVDAGPHLRMWYVAARDGVTVVAGSGPGADEQTRLRLLRFDARGSITLDLLDDDPMPSWCSGVEIDQGGRVFVAGGTGVVDPAPWLRVYGDDGALQASEALVGLSDIRPWPSGGVLALRHFPVETQLDGYVLDELDL